jgi:hypothetical protein
MKAGDDTVTVGRLPAGDDFDHWVSGRIDTVSTATNASLQYTGSSNYVPGYADLYTYGAWSSCGGYGYGWRPFGASFGWSPFTAGQWLWDPGFGWTFASFQPWGWAPYHYGGWLFDASCGGWFYSPPAYYGYGGYGGYPRRRIPPIVHPPHPIYRASTAVFVRQNGKLGVVPMHPLDKSGKTPLNLEHGVFSTEPARNATAPVQSAAAGQKWETLKSPPREALNSGLVATTAPTRTSRTLIEGNSGARIVSLSHDSSIVYDPREHRFINTNVAPSSARDAAAIAEKNGLGESRNEHIVEGPRTNVPTGTGARVPPATSARVAAAPSRSFPSPPAPHSSSSGGGYRGGGTESAGGGSRSSSSSASSASASHASAPASSGGGGGGRPH